MALELPTSAIPDIVESPKRSSRGPSKRTDELPADESSPDEAPAESDASTASTETVAGAPSPDARDEEGSADVEPSEPRHAGDCSPQQESLQEDDAEDARVGDEIVIPVGAEELARTKTLRELRDMCADRGLSSAGKKSALVDRLLSSMPARSE